MVIELAIACSTMVLPVRGAATIRARWPLPRGVIRSMTRVVRFSGVGLELDLVLGVERREVLEEDALFAAGRRLEVDRLDLDQREVALALLRRPDLPGHRVAGVQVELADLRRRHVDVVGAGQVVVVGGAEEAEAVGQHFEHALGEDQAALLGAGAEDLEDQLLLAHARGAGDVEVPRHLGEGRDAHLLERGQVEGDDLLGLGRGCGGSGCRSSFAISFHSSSSPSPVATDVGRTGPSMVLLELTR